jgi:hypothetical protein
MGVPYRGVVALFVGFADLIPLVVATLGAVVAIAVAALHSLPAAIVVLVVFVVYQQLENHVLQPVIMSRTVQLSALTVLVSILIGVELFGFLGALLAIPVAGVLHVIGRDLYDSYRGRLIGRVFLPRSAWSGSCSSVGVRGMASLPSRQTASLSSATPGAPRPADRLQGHARSKGRTMRHRQHGPRHPASEHAIESRSCRCSWDGTGPAPHTT